MPVMAQTELYACFQVVHWRDVSTYCTLSDFKLLRPLVHAACTFFECGKSDFKLLLPVVHAADVLFVGKGGAQAQLRATVQGFKDQFSTRPYV